MQENTAGYGSAQQPMSDRRVEPRQSFLNDIESFLSQSAEAIAQAGNNLADLGFFDQSPASLNKLNETAPQPDTRISAILDRFRTLRDSCQRVANQVQSIG